MSAFVALAAPWLALALCIGVLIAAVGAATARSLFGLILFFVCAGAFAAAAIAVLGGGDATLAQALFGVGVTPVLLLACLLLSARTAKPRRGARPWITIAAAAAAAIATLWATPELAIAPAVRAGDAEPTPWIAPLLFSAIAVAVALLGYGERGALERAPERDL